MPPLDATTAIPSPKKSGLDMMVAERCVASSRRIENEKHSIDRMVEDHCGACMVGEHSVACMVGEHSVACMVEDLSGACMVEE